MISAAYQVIIKAAKAANEAATASAHLDHRVKTIKWDEMHTVKLCADCCCTITNPVKVKNRPPIKLESAFFGGYNNQQVRLFI